MVKKCAFKISLICFFCAKDKDNGAELLKGSSRICYCVLYNEVIYVKSRANIKV
jgi:hypothetical protein